MPCSSDVGKHGAFWPLWDPVLRGTKHLFWHFLTLRGVSGTQDPWEIEWRGIMSCNYTYKPISQTHTPKRPVNTHTHSKPFTWKISHLGCDKALKLCSRTKADLQLVKPGSITAQSIYLVIRLLTLPTSFSLQSITLSLFWGDCGRNRQTEGRSRKPASVEEKKEGKDTAQACKHN